MFASSGLVKEEFFIAKRLHGKDLKRGGEEGGDKGQSSS